MIASNVHLVVNSLHCKLKEILRDMLRSCIAFFIHNNMTNWLQSIESRVTVLDINITSNATGKPTHRRDSIQGTDYIANHFFLNLKVSENL